MFTASKRQVGNGKSREGRQFEILTLLYEARYESPIARNGAQEHFPKCWLTSHEIARAMHLTPSQHLRGMLYELYTEGLILIDYVQHRKNVTKLVYVIADNARWSEKWAWAFDEYLKVTPYTEPLAI